LKKLICLLACLPAFAFAAQEGEITMKSTAPAAPGLSSNLTEAGFAYSSINNGSAFATVAILHEWDNGIALGARGLLPMQYTKQASAYMGQLLARFMVLNDTNQIFIEPTLTQGWFNDTFKTMAFGMFGADFGYQRQINSQFAVGGRIGMDYSRQRITQDTILSDTDVIYNKIAVTGAYYF
jgi:hypothetical protein